MKKMVMITLTMMIVSGMIITILLIMMMTDAYRHMFFADIIDI